MKLCVIVPALLVLALATSDAEAGQVSVVSLHPGGTASRAMSVSSTQQAGRVSSGGNKAIVWSGTPGSFTLLHPATASVSELIGTSGAEQVGYAIVGGVSQASRWTGNAASWVSLHPTNAVFSSSRGCAGGQQVGVVQLAGSSSTSRASLWTGSASSWVDLSPAGSDGSQANGTNGTTQVGWASLPGGQQAGIWNGTAASWVSLQPDINAYSQGLGISPDGGQQVGFVSFGASGFHASLWSGTPASWIDLHPAGATTSQAVGTSGAQQVGWSTVNSAKHASLWSGTAASWEDLHTSLPAGFDESQATGVWSDGAMLYVSGYAHRVSPSRDEAILWKKELPPLADLSGDGVVNGADLGILLGSWGQCANCAADLNHDGAVDGTDLGELLGAWNS